MTTALSGTSSVDPELIQARIDALAVELERNQVAAIVSAGFACLLRIKGIDFAALERATGNKAARELWTAVSEPVASMWAAAEELQVALAPLVAEHEARLATSSADGDAVGDLALSEAVAPSPEGRREVAKPALTPLSRIGETAWATSFVLSGEIARFRKRLPSLLKIPDGWDLLGDLQDHLGHVKAGINAILTGVYASLPASRLDEARGEQSLELIASRELRHEVFGLRDHILEVERQLNAASPAGWQPSLLRARSSLERFMFGPGFAWMRAGDKRSLLKQHQALVEVLEVWSPLRAVPAKRTVENLARYLEALEVINMRECLVVHDRRGLATVVEQARVAVAEQGPQRREAIGAALAALAEVQGRDRELDRLLEQTLAPGSPVPVEAILARAQTLLAQLGG